MNGQASYTPESDVTLYAVWEQNAPNTYSVTYDANGGTSAPEAQTKTHGTTLTLSSTIPTRADAEGESLTVMLDANGGNVDTASLNAAQTVKYTFRNWNTEADGSGASFNAGGKYSMNESVILYAQWTSSESTAAVTLPTPTRDGYTFKGWGTSESATSGVTGSYTPTGNATLYAVWEQNAAPPQDLFVDVTDPGAYYYEAVYNNAREPFPDHCRKGLLFHRIRFFGEMFNLLAPADEQISSGSFYLCLV